MTPIKIAVLLIAGGVSGCVFMEVEEQQRKLGELCTFTGEIRAEHSAKERPLVAMLARRGEGSGSSWHAVDQYVMERPGRWEFLAAAGEYRLGAFVDSNADLEYQSGEPFATAARDQTFTCISGARFDDIELSTPIRAARGGASFTTESPSIEASTLGQLTAVGAIVSLDDERFSLENASNSLWRPYDSMFSAAPGIYFLEPYDPRKVPVLFVHGMSDSPARFAYLIERMDRERFQPWLYYYPSGIHLDSVVDHLTQTMAKLRIRLGVDRTAVVAHSIGGLVARAYLQRELALHKEASKRILVTISTPWEGHKAAENGVKYAPTAVQSWHDIAPGSEYLRNLFASPLPSAVEHHLLFSFRRDSRSKGLSSDQSVTVASQLSGAAQAEASKVYGFDDTHKGMLTNGSVAALLNELLSQHFGTHSLDIRSSLREFRQAPTHASQSAQGYP